MCSHAYANEEEGAQGQCSPPFPQDGHQLGGGESKLKAGPDYSGGTRGWPEQVSGLTKAGS